MPETMIRGRRQAAVVCLELRAASAILMPAVAFLISVYALAQCIDWKFPREQRGPFF